MSLWYSVFSLIQPSGTGTKHTPCPPKHIPSPAQQPHPCSRPSFRRLSPNLPTYKPAHSQTPFLLHCFAASCKRAKPIPFPFNHFPALCKNTGGGTQSAFQPRHSALATRHFLSATPLESALTQNAPASPLQSALTKTASVTPLESALTKKPGGWGTLR